MNKNARRIKIILVISVLLTVITMLLYFFDPDQGYTSTMTYIILSIWMFSITPAYVLIFNWLKRKKIVDTLFIGSYAGITLGFASLLIPAIIAPILMILFYIKRIKNQQNYWNNL